MGPRNRAFLFGVIYIFMIKRVLGLDVSSSTIGYCLLELDDSTNAIKLKLVDYYKPTKNGSMLERLRDTRDRMADIINKLQPTHIAIEDIIMFIKGLSTAQTVITLAAFNRMMGLLSFDYTDRPPALYNVMDMRRGLQKHGVPNKDDMPELVAEHLGITFPWQHNCKGNIKVENGDMADAMAVALFHAYVLSGKLLAPVHIKKKRPKPKPKKRKGVRSKKKR